MSSSKGAIDVPHHPMVAPVRRSHTLFKVCDRRTGAPSDGSSRYHPMVPSVRYVDRTPYLRSAIDVPGRTIVNGAGRYVDRSPHLRCAIDVPAHHRMVAPGAIDVPAHHLMVARATIRWSRYVDRSPPLRSAIDVPAHHQMVARATYHPMERRPGAVMPNGNRHGWGGGARAARGWRRARLPRARIDCRLARLSPAGPTI